MIVLLLGGTRSGKSAIAERMAAEHAAASGAVAITYVATAHLDPSDENHARRVAAHQARRPTGWVTVECEEPTDLVAHLRSSTGVVLVDSLGSWLVRHPDFEVDTSALRSALRERTASTVLVSEEVGLAVHPPTAVGRRYIDALGTLNQQVAAVADRVLLVVAGRTLEMSETGRRLDRETDPGGERP